MQKRKGRRSVACLANAGSYHVKVAPLLALPLISISLKAAFDS